jgi:hypothetical protein
MARKALKSKAKGKARKGNPAGAAAAGFEDFHGRPSQEVITVTRKIHYHAHLAAAGELTALVVISRETGQKVRLEDFGGALLCFNERRTQLFIEGGDQKVDLDSFGIDTPHEMQALGEVRVVEYFTTKDHLGREGGTATYVHKFDKPYPTLQYDTMNKQLLFSGGRYTVLPEGIDH